MNNSPIIKDLTAHDMSADTPAVVIALVPQPIMTKNLNVKVVRFKGAVVNMALWTLEKEEGMMIDGVGTTV
jgi:uncharacterized lipoprotein YmbA